MLLIHKTDLPPLTGLRFMAAFSILYMHTTIWCLPFNDSQFFTKIAAPVGVYGMPLFFVLSGFVIHYNYGSSFHGQPYIAAARDFLSARFARIYPLFIFFCIFGAVSDFTANWIRDQPRYFFSYIFHSVTLTQSWVYKIVVNDRLLLANGFGLAWSLSCEFFFYLAYIFFVFAILPLRRPVQNLIVMTLFSIAVFGALLFAMRHADDLMNFARLHVNHFIAAQDDFDNSFYRWFFYYSPYTRIWEFIVGCLAAQLFVSLQDRPVSETERAWGLALLSLVLASLLAFGVLYVTLPSNGTLGGLVRFFAMNFACAAPLAVLIFCSARYRTAVSAFLSLPWIVWLGDISYSIYAVHTWTLRPFIRPSVDIDLVFGIDALFRMVLALAFTIIVAAATYSFIEVPCRRYLRAKLMRGRAPTAPDLAIAGAVAAQPDASNRLSRKTTASADVQ